ncbi:MAG: DUF748 domain-containing protein [Anaeromyxobacteraceae bacterium]
MTTSKRRRLLARLGLGAGALAVLYVLLGFVLAPRLVKGAIEEKGSAALHRAVTVAEVKVNPLVLSVTVRGLAVAEPAGGNLASWESLYVRLAPWKVLAGDVGIAEIVLVKPAAALGLDAKGRLTIQDLLDPDPAAPPPTGEKEGKPALGLALDRLEIDQATLSFHDDTRAPRFETVLGPLTVKLSQFRTRGGGDSPYAFTGATEAGETFSWSGTLQSEPLRSAGTLSFKGIDLPKYGAYSRDTAPKLLVASGKLGLETRYELSWGDAARRLALSGLGVTVDDLALARLADRAVAARLPHIEVKGGEVDVLGKTATVAEVRVAGGALTARREPGGAMALLEMLELAPSPPSPWRWKVGTVAIDDVALDVEDLTTPRPVKLALAGLRVRLSGMEQRADVACPMQASVRVGEAGTFAAEGTVWPNAARAKLALKAAAIDLVPLAPLAEAGAPVRVAEARFGMDARVEVDAAQKEPTWRFAGDVALEGLRLRHPAREEELVRLTALRVEGVDAESTGRASVKAVRLVEPRLRAIVFEDGTTGFAPAAKPGEPPAVQPAAAQPAAATKAASTKPGAAPAWRTTLGVFQVLRGQLSYVDRSVKPPVLLALDDVEGKVTNLSSDPKVRSTVDLKARVGAAPLAITGTVNPLQAEAYTDVAVRSKGIELTPLSPYAGRHLGYLLEKGKLDLDLAYKVQARALQAGNVVKVDQLTLGEKTDSPDATSAPVKLGLALLRDKDGVILLDLPIDGNLDDPEFRYGKVVWRAVLNVLVKVATSPFSALASLVGGDKEDISLVEFPAGAAKLDEAGLKRVQLLAGALAQRPALSLDLEGTADPAADGTALRRAELDRTFRVQEAKARGVSPEAVTFTPEQRAALVEKAWRAAFPPAPPAAGQAAAKAPTPAEMEAQLLGRVATPPEALKALAVERTQVVRDALLAAGLDPARLFTVEGGERAQKEPGPRAYFTVK